MLRVAVLFKSCAAAYRPHDAGFKAEELIGADAHALIPPGVMTPEDHKERFAEYVRTDGRPPSFSTDGSDIPDGRFSPGAVGNFGREIKVLAKDGRVVSTLVGLERMNLTDEEAVAHIHDFANRDVPPYVFIACLQDLTATIERARVQACMQTQKAILEFVLHEVGLYKLNPVV